MKLVIFITGVKDVSQSKVGDTITAQDNMAQEALPGYRDPQPMVYAGLFPIDNAQFPDLRDALDKLKLNDAALVYEPGNFGCFRASVSLRIPWLVAYGDCVGTFTPRIWS